MKNISLREFALVCSPLLVVAVVGFALSRRKPPSLDEGKLHLVFHVEKPTVLESFNGADAALVVALKGADADKLNTSFADYSLELKSKSKAYKSSCSDDGSRFWNDVWKGNWNNSRFAINTRQIPPGKLRFYFTTKTSYSGMVTPAPTPAPHLNGSWLINRALIKPMNFKRMPRAPLVVLRSVNITTVAGGTGRYVSGECVFYLVGANMSVQTPTEISFSGGVTTPTISSGLSWGTTASATPSPKPMQRSWTWSVSAPTGIKTKLIAHVSGRLSVDGRWPLAFEVTPFDLANVKSGQSLSFKSWPVPTPISK